MASERGRAVYRSRRWAAVRKVALGAAGYRCSKCGRAGRLEVHHAQSVALDGDAFDLTNLVVVCRDCHFESHGWRKPAPADPRRRAMRDWARE